mgnify:CR=1 FL=1
MLACLIMLVIYCIVAVILVYIVETLLGLFIALPAQIPVLIRCFAALLVLVALLNCLGLLSGFHGRLVR